MPAYAVVVALAVLTTHTLIAQTVRVDSTPRAVLSGLVLRDDSTKAPIRDAEVIIAGQNRSVRTNSAGAYRLDGIPLGIREIEVRALGFQPLATQLVLSRADTLERDFLLVAQRATELPTVEVSAKSSIPEFEERRLLGHGQFLTREVFEKQAHRKMGEILRQVPGLRIVRGANNPFEAYAINSRGRITMLGNNPKCYVHIYVNDAAVFSGDSAQLFNLNAMSPNQIEGVEYYSGGASIPPKYNRTGSACGVLVIWTRR